MKQTAIASATPTAADSSATRTSATTAPIACAPTNAGTLRGAIPAKVLLSMRPTVTAGFAKLVELVKSNPNAFDDTDVEIMWIVAEAMAKAKQNSDAVAIYAIKSVTEQAVPPTLNLDEPDEGCDIDLVPKQAKQRKVRYALSNSFGFGGTNASLIFGAV